MTEEKLNKIVTNAFLKLSEDADATRNSMINEILEFADICENVTDDQLELIVYSSKVAYFESLKTFENCIKKIVYDTHQEILKSTQKD